MTAGDPRSAPITSGASCARRRWRRSGSTRTQDGRAAPSRAPTASPSSSET